MENESSEFGATTSKLVAKAQKLTKKPTLSTDILGILDECVMNFERQCFYLENGLYDINFAEPALIIDSVTLIFGKKVDLLWDLLLNYQKALTKFNVDEERIRNEERLIQEQLDKYKRKRKKPPDVPAEQQQQETITEPDPNRSNSPPRVPPIEEAPPVADDPNLNAENSLVLNGLDPSDLTAICQVRPEDPEVECNCDYSTLLNNHLSGQGMMGCGCDANMNLIDIELEDDLIKTFLEKRNVDLSEVTEADLVQLCRCIAQELFKQNALKQKRLKLCPKRSSILVTRLADEILQQYLQKDGQFSDGKSTNGESNCPNDSGIDETDTEDRDETRSITSIEERLFEECVKVDDSNSRDKDTQTDKPEESDLMCNPSEHLTNKTVEETITKPLRQKRAVLRKKKEEEVEAPKRKRARTPKVKLRKSITRLLKDYEVFFYENYNTQLGEGEIIITDIVRAVYDERTREFLLLRRTIKTSLKKFEIFFWRNYNPEEGEGVPEEPNFSDDEPEYEEEPDIINEVSGYDDNRTMTPTFETIRSNSCQDSGILSDMCPSIRSTQTPTTPFSDTADNMDEEEECVEGDIAPEDLLDREKVLLEKLKVRRENELAWKKYNEWQEEIRTKLRNTDRQDFDIHRYEEMILEKIPDKNPVNLSEVMRGQKPSEVCRLFAASLQLINNSNIQVLNHEPAVLANERVQFRVLNRNRHHEHLSTYQAPSVGQRSEALEKIRSGQFVSQPATSNTTESDTSDFEEHPKKRRKYTKKIKKTVQNKLNSIDSIEFEPQPSTSGCSQGNRTSTSQDYIGDDETSDWEGYQTYTNFMSQLSTSNTSVYQSPQIDSFNQEANHPLSYESCDKNLINVTPESNVSNVLLNGAASGLTQENYFGVNTQSHNPNITPKTIITPMGYKPRIIKRGKPRLHEGEVSTGSSNIEPSQGCGQAQLLNGVSYQDFLNRESVGESSSKKRRRLFP